MSIPHLCGRIPSCDLPVADSSRIAGEPDTRRHKSCKLRAVVRRLGKRVGQGGLRCTKPTRAGRRIVRGMTNDSERALRGTPYLTHGDVASEERFAKVSDRAVEVRQRALTAQRRISSEAAELLGPYMIAVRSDLVAESNRIEGYDWTSQQIRELVGTHAELLSGPVGSFVAALRGEDRVYQVLGLYRAHLIAEEWVSTSTRPREYEIRGLHRLIIGHAHFAGQYKTVGNQIAGSSHKTTDPWDVSRAMNELCDWWTNASGEPALEATVAHAWLTHIHPFEDGNGRMARLLANLALTQSGYPPFLIRSDADRGQYYDALASSDEGDILPLYDLVVKILRRTVRTMSSPGYVRDVARDRLLTSMSDEWSIWCQLPKQFVSALTDDLKSRGWSLEVQGYPDLSSFSLLAQRDSDGNSWFIKVFDPARRSRWLLWYGFNSHEITDLLGGPTGYPSVFISVRDPDPSAVHPYRQFFEDGVPIEILFRPLEYKPVLIRWDWGLKVDDMTIPDAARKLGDALTNSGWRY